jgi:hypothetical protein
VLELQNLQNRVPFGPANDPAQCVPWDPPVTRFDLAWLKGPFITLQRDRLTKMTAAIASTNQEIEKLRAEATHPIEAIGLRQANGNILKTGSDVMAERTLRTHAQDQIVRGILALRRPLELVVVPLLRNMDRASQTADTLRQRIFSKEACLSRATLGGLTGAGFAQLKANYAAMLCNLAPIELFAYAQRALDDGSADSLPILDSIRLENFRRKKDDRAFLNAKLLELANIPEFNEAGPLLDEVQAIHKQALLLWAQFANDTSRVSSMKLAVGLAKLGVKDPDDPYADLA